MTLIAADYRKTKRDMLTELRRLGYVSADQGAGRYWSKELSVEPPIELMLYEGCDCGGERAPTDPFAVVSLCIFDDLYGTPVLAEGYLVELLRTGATEDAVRAYAARLMMGA